MGRGQKHGVTPAWPERAPRATRAQGPGHARGRHYQGTCGCAGKVRSHVAPWEACSCRVRDRLRASCPHGHRAGAHAAQTPAYTLSTGPAAAPPALNRTPGSPDHTSSPLPQKSPGPQPRPPLYTAALGGGPQGLVTHLCCPLGPSGHHGKMKHLPAPSTHWHYPGRQGCHAPQPPLVISPQSPPQNPPLG